ncbi:MAG: hypothetical protein NC396_07585 [Bacteroides sp.]|nr:hypothetical protein [Bacteroides sp.]MCM1086184.1 hypothetical protein [Bacteroides sp.]
MKNLLFPWGRWVSALAVTLVITMAFGSLTSCKDDEGPTPPPENPVDDAQTVTMKKPWECYYFVTFEKDFGNYWFELATGEVGMSGFHSFPLNPGDYILDIDIFTNLDPDHANPVLPEGTYRPGEKGELNVFTLENTMAVYNVERVGDTLSRIRYIRFSDGTITVTHTADNGYRLVCDFTAKEDGSRWKFTYEGQIPFEDQSGWEDEDWWGFQADLDIEAVRANLVKNDDSETTGCENYILRFFDIDKITSDYIHPNDIGHKIQISINTEPGKGIAGTYTASSTAKAGTFRIGERMGGFAAESYVEKVRDDYKVRYALINAGTVTITDNGDGNYTVTVDCTTPDDYKVKMRYTGKIQDITGLKPVYSTLTSDITVTPTVCTYADYYGDFYLNGTVNYGVTVANETEVLTFEFIAATGDATELPTGTFTVKTDDEEGNPSAGALIPGAIHESEGEVIPSAYIKYNDAQNKVIGYAPVAGGSLTISKEGDGYKFTYDLEDDASPAHHITGACTVPVQEIKDWTEELSSARKMKRAVRK